MHGDAWGPSTLALKVLAYILHDLRENNIRCNHDRLGELLIGWNPACRSLPSEHLAWWTAGPRCQLPIPIEHSQIAHWTLPNVAETNIMEKVDQENDILEQLKTIVDA